MSKEHALQDIFWLWSDALNNRATFAKTPKRMNADRTQYVWSSNGLINIVVMTLLTIGSKRFRPPIPPALIR